jgi:hypothetical protein
MTQEHSCMTSARRGIPAAGGAVMIVPPLLLLLTPLPGAAAHELAAARQTQPMDPKSFRSCTECVAAGLGWSVKRRKYAHARVYLLDLGALVYAHARAWLRAMNLCVVAGAATFVAGVTAQAVPLPSRATSVQLSSRQRWTVAALTVSAGGHSHTG